MRSARDLMVQTNFVIILCFAVTINKMYMYKDRYYPLTQGTVYYLSSV